METDASNLDRYHRQTLLPSIGAEGQRRLLQSRVLIVGCGALGSAAAEQLARAGVGAIRVADRDVVELTNLQRQVLFDESDAREDLPKAVAAARRLRQINSQITVEPLVVDVDSDNIEGFVDGVDLIIDGTDNVQARYLINDVSVKRTVPWIYGACVGTEGRVLAIRPPRSACLRCVFPEPPQADELPTCDTAGVLGAAAAVVGAAQATAAIKLLTGNEAAVGDEMLTFDLWSNRIKLVSVRDAKRSDCPTCGQSRFEFLHARSTGVTTRLCGRNAVQIRPARGLNGFDLDALAVKLAGSGSVRKTDHLLRATLDGGAIELTVFTDGRVIVHGTADPARARSIHARFVGS